MLNIVILAAGRGRRMCSDQPKVMQKLSGRPLISHVISVAQELAGPNLGSITVVTGHGCDQVDPVVSKEGCQIVHQQEQLGTGHALNAALQTFDSDDGITLVLYGDVPLITTRHLLPLLSSGASHLTVLTAHVDDPTGYGRIVRDQLGQLIAIVEHEDASTDELAICEINSGIYAGPTAVFKQLLPRVRDANSQGEYYLTDCVEISVGDGFPVSTVLGPLEVTLGVNDQQQLALVNARHQETLRNKLLSDGISLLDPKSVCINGTVSAGRDVVIEPNVMLKGHIELGDRVMIGFGSYLHDVIIGSDTILKPYTVMESAIVGRSAQVGPLSRLRPGTELADQTCVGNFCEIKNARVGIGTKINHLSYVGDTVIGESTNVGAGTITCNYDGVNKYTTNIGHDVFVGSNSSLVAPVTIHDGATIGAGSVVTKDVGVDELALTRAKQIHIPGYQRPKKSKG